MKIAVAGVWHVHAPQYTDAALRCGEVVGVWDENNEWKNKFAVEKGIPAFDTFEDLLNSDAEGVIVCAATNRHAELIEKIAKSGKDIFTEKVLSLNPVDDEKIEKAIKRAGVRFVISFPQLTFSGPLTVFSAVSEGKIGKINYVRFRNCHGGSIAHWLPAHFYDPVATGGGAMIDLGAHGMYIIGHLLGEPCSYRSTFTHVCRDEKDKELNPAELEDNAVTVMTYPDGAIAINETGFVSVGAPQILEVGGSDGYITMSGNTVILRGKSTDNKPVELPLLPKNESPIEAFVKGLPAEGCDMEGAKRLTRMMVGAYKNTKD